MPTPKKVKNHSPEARTRAQRLRTNMSVSEIHLWERIRKCGLGFRFRRQVPIGPYTLDFYCAEATLCVEVDGEQHALRRHLDVKRDAFLAARGIATIRIPSLDLFDSTGVSFAKWLDRIQFECESRAGRKFYSH